MGRSWRGKAGSPKARRWRSPTTSFSHLFSPPGNHKWRTSEADSQRPLSVPGIDQALQVIQPVRYCLWDLYSRTTSQEFHPPSEASASVVESPSWSHSFLSLSVFA